MKHELTTTIETRIPKQLLPLVDDVMMEYSKHYNHAKWCYVARKNRGENINKPAFCAEFKIPSRLFNAIKGDVDGMFQSQTSNMQRYIVEAHQKISDATAYLEEQQSKIAVLTAPSRKAKPNQATLNKMYRAIRGKRRLIQRKESAISRWTKLIESKMVSTCAGSRSLFSKQHQLAENNYHSHGEWLSDYRLKRNDEFYIKGSKDEAKGNSLCRLSRDDSGEFNIALTMPKALLDKGFATQLVLNNLKFSYKPEILLAAAESNERRVKLGSKKNLESPFVLDNHAKNIEVMRDRQQGIISNMMRRGDKESDVSKAIDSYAKKISQFSQPTKNNLLSDFGQAISYRFKRDRKGWRIIVTVTYSLEKAYVSNVANGCIGIDLNEHHLAVTEVNDAGGKVCTSDLYFHKDKNHDITSRQTRTALEGCIKVVIAKAIATKKPIAVEDLDFKVSKAQLKKGFDKSFNKTVSSMITAKFISTLKARCIESGIELITVKAAYTSMIGRLKYATQFNFNIHSAAAMVVARRAMGKIDMHFPKQSILIVRNDQVAFPVPEDSGKHDTFGYYKKVKVAYDKWSYNMYNSLRNNDKTLIQCGYDEDVLI